MPRYNHIKKRNLNYKSLQHTLLDPTGLLCLVQPGSSGVSQQMGLHGPVGAM